MENFEKITKLPRAYYKYRDADLSSFSKDEDASLSFSFSTYQICKLEQYCLAESANVASIVRQVFIDNGILAPEDCEVRQRAKLGSEFTGKDCEAFKGLRSFKVVHVVVSEYAKAKIIKAMIDLDIDHTFYVKSKLIKNAIRPKPYQVLDFEDLGN